MSTTRKVDYAAAWNEEPHRLPADGAAVYVGKILDWHAFRFKRKRWLALYRSPNACTVVDDNMNHYGTYFSTDGFKRMYERDGESLRLPNEVAVW